MVIHSKNMLVVRFARTAILATALIGQAGALMGQTGPSADNATPSPVAAKAPTPKDPITGMPLPLHPWEKIIPFADGRCGTIVGKGESGTAMEWSWQGACRFGLAHGAGSGVEKDSKTFSTRFIYGARPTDNRGKIPGPKVTFFDDRSFSPTYRFVAFYGTDRFDPNAFDSVATAISLRRHSGAITETNFLGVRTFACPFKGFADAPELVPSRDQRKAISDVCSRVPKGADVGVNIFLENSIWDKVGEDWVKKGAGTRQVWICRLDIKGAKPDCSEAIQTAIAPYLTEINEIILADKDAVERASAEITKRFEPLEIAARPKRLELARRIAASYVPRSAPAIKPAAPASSAVGTKRPTEMGKGK